MSYLKGYKDKLQTEVNVCIWFGMLYKDDDGSYIFVIYSDTLGYYRY